MNKKGFTLVELLAVIAILGIITGIATLSVFTIQNSSNKKTYETKVKMIERASELYGEENKRNITECDTYTSITVKTLLDEDYLSADKIESGVSYVIDPRDKTSLNDKIINICKDNYRINVIYDPSEE